MADNRTFTVKSNAKRGAERLLATGGAPEAAYTIRTRDDGLFEIVWLTASPGLAMAAWPAPKTTEELARKLAAATAEAEPKTPAMTPDQALDSICGAGTAADMPRLLAAPEPKAAAPKGPRAKYAAPVAPGAMPVKPVLTAAGFAASYQNRIDRLAELAAAGDWAAVESFEVKGKNTYSKIVARYRDQLVAAHAAQPAAAGGRETLVEGCERYLASCGL